MDVTDGTRPVLQAAFFCFGSVFLGCLLWSSRVSVVVFGLFRSSVELTFEGNSCNYVTSCSLSFKVL